MRRWPDFMRTRNTRVRPARAADSISCCVLTHGATAGGASAGRSGSAGGGGGGGAGRTWAKVAVARLSGGAARWQGEIVLGTVTLYRIPATAGRSTPPLIIVGSARPRRTPRLLA